MGLNYCLCGKTEEEHRTFPFVSMPDEHRGVYPCLPEWLPNVDKNCGPYGDPYPEGINPYPARVAYKFSDGEPTVQVHEGEDEGLWMPCSCVTKDGITYWDCVPKGPKNPCGNTYMRSIST